ncbi:MAG: CPBP family glutamic-type intramembrane protease [bacterium]|nr:CPBP family glutamic-type intramembrane protease [bacterium]
MKLIKLARHNHVVGSILTLSGIAVLSIIAMILVLSIPADFGAPYEGLSPGQSYAFDPWEINLGSFHVSYPEGGVVVNAYRRGELSALVFLAEGIAYYSVGGEEYQYPVNELFLHMHPSEIAILRGQTYIEERILPESIAAAGSLLDKVATGEPILLIFGVKKVYLPRLGVARAEMFGPFGENATFISARKTIWQTPGEPTIITNQPTLPTYPPINQFVTSLILATIMVGAVAISIIFVTMSHPTPPIHPFPKALLLWPIALVLVHALVEAYIRWLNLNWMVVIGWRLMILSGAFWIAELSGDDYSFFGLSPKLIKSGLKAGVFCGVLLHLCGSIALPDGLNSFTLLDFSIHLLSSIILAGAFREIIWRGLVQGSLRATLGFFPSLALTAALAALASLAPAIVMGDFGSGIYVQSLYVVPLGALILGYLYERTGSLYASITAVTILELLPFIFRF